MNSTYPKTADSIAEKVQQHIDKLVGLKFIYRVRSNDTASSESMETLAEYSTLPSNNPDKPYPWFCWKEFWQINAIEWELNQFWVYDGERFYFFDRIVPFAPVNFSRSGWIEYSEGRVEVCNEPSVQLAGKFKGFVCLGLAGYGKTAFDQHINESFPHPWEIVDSPSPDEFVLERQMKLPEWEKGYTIRAHVAMKPEPIVVHLSLPSGNSSADFAHFAEVLELATFDDVVYPSKGKDFSPARGSVKHDVVYEFEVESVERVSEQSRKTWVPNFPHGTHVTGIESQYIAHTREVQLRDFLTRLAIVPEHVKINWLMNCLVGAVRVGIVVLLPFFRFAAKRNALKNGWIIKRP